MRRRGLPAERDGGAVLAADRLLRRLIAKFDADVAEPVFGEQALQVRADRLICGIAIDAREQTQTHAQRRRRALDDLRPFDPGNPVKHGGERERRNRDVIAAVRWEREQVGV